MYSVEDNVSFGFDEVDTIASFTYLMTLLACAMRKHNCKKKNKIDSIKTVYNRIYREEKHINESKFIKKSYASGVPCITLWNDLKL